jgi:hypothetical protein
MSNMDGTRLRRCGQSTDKSKSKGFTVEHDGYSRLAAAHFGCGAYSSHWDRSTINPRSAVADLLLDDAE